MIMLVLIALWATCGIATAIWFHRWRTRAGYRYSRRWHIAVDYGVSLLSGPLGLLFAARRAYLHRKTWYY
jgi:hypothetical protein